MLSNDGYPTIDGDNYPGLSVWVDKQTGQPAVPPDSSLTKEWFDQHRYIWDEQVLTDVLDSTPGEAIIYGTSAGQEKFFYLFRKVFLLKMDEPEIIEQRLKNRPGKVFGKSQQELDFLLSWYKEYQYNYQQHDAIVIDATLPVNAICHFIKEHIRQPEPEAEPQRQPMPLKLQLEF
jgi:hypothetical protein